MDQPSSLLELSEGVAEQLGIDTLFDLIKLLNTRLPVGCQDFGRKLSPCRSGNLVVICGEHTELVK